MRKKIFGIVVMAAIAVIAGWNIGQNENDIKLSNLALSNVEALAADEEVTLDCPGGQRECARVIVGNTVHLFNKRDV